MKIIKRFYGLEIGRTFTISELYLQNNIIEGNFETQEESIMFIDKLNLSNNSEYSIELDLSYNPMKDLSNVSYIGDQVLELLKSPLQSSITDLNLSGNNLNQSDFSFITGLNNINKLYISNCNLSDIPQAVKNLTGISELDLSFISNFSSLSKLDLSKCGIGNISNCRK